MIPDRTWPPTSASRRVGPRSMAPAETVGLYVSRLRLQDSGGAVATEFDSGVISERPVGRAWPAAGDRLVLLEMHY